jgi:hypothetical protein
MLIFDIIAGFLIGTMTGMGIGGGGLLVIYLTLLRNTTQLTAQGANLYFFIVASAASLIVHLNRRRLDFSQIIPAAAAGMVFAYFGSLAAGIFSEELIRRFFGIMLTASGAAGLLRGVKFPRILSDDEDELG